MLPFINNATIRNLKTRSDENVSHHILSDAFLYTMLCADRQC